MLELKEFRGVAARPLFQFRVVVAFMVYGEAVVRQDWGLDLRCWSGRDSCIGCQTGGAAL